MMSHKRAALHFERGRRHRCQRRVLGKNIWKGLAWDKEPLSGWMILKSYQGSDSNNPFYECSAMYAEDADMWLVDLSNQLPTFSMPGIWKSKRKVISDHLKQQTLRRPSPPFPSSLPHNGKWFYGSHNEPIRCANGLFFEVRKWA